MFACESRGCLPLGPGGLSASGSWGLPLGPGGGVHSPDRHPPRQTHPWADSPNLLNFMQGLVPMCCCKATDTGEGVIHD